MDVGQWVPQTVVEVRAAATLVRAGSLRWASVQRMAALDAHAMARVEAALAARLALSGLAEALEDKVATLSSPMSSPMLSRQMVAQMWVEVVNLLRQFDFARDRLIEPRPGAVAVTALGGPTVTGQIPANVATAEGRRRLRWDGRGRFIRGALTDKQDWFVRLIGQGVGNADACRTVGIYRRTGTRWRFGRTILNTAGEPVHSPPVQSRLAPRSRASDWADSSERRNTVIG